MISSKFDISLIFISIDIIMDLHRNFNKVNIERSRENSTFLRFLSGEIEKCLEYYYRFTSERSE